MASTSGRLWPPSPPPPPPRCVRSRRTDVARLDQEDKFVIIRSSPPRDGNAIDEVPADITPQRIDVAELLDQNEKPLIIKCSPPRHGGADITDVAELEETGDKLVVIRRPPRRHGKDIYEGPADDPPPETREEAKIRRILVQDYQELSRAEKDFLQFAAFDLFLSNHPTREISIVSDFTKSSIFQENPLSEVKELWNFCTRGYPNAVSLMLASLLNSSLPSAPRILIIVNLLHLTLIRIHGQDRSSIDERVLLHLRPLLLNVIKNHELISNILDLSVIVARIFEIKRWRKLLVYLFDASHMDLETKQEMASG